MNFLKGKNMEDLRKSNSSKIMEILFKYGPISRAEISDISGLTPASISKLTRELFGRGLIEEAGIQDDNSSVGRKRISLQLAADARVTIGVEIGVRGITLGLINLKGKLLNKYVKEFTTEVPEKVIDLVIAEIRSILQEHPKLVIIGVGVAATGLINSDSGTVIHSPNLHWKNIKLKEKLAAALNIPVVVDNNVRLMALGENMFFHNWLEKPRLILIHVGYGIGCGIVLNGELYYGRGFGAGELGHTTILPGGPLCSCGKKGCLEAIASGQAVTHLYAKLIAEDWHYQSNLQKLISLDRQDDKIAGRVMREAGTYMGIGISNMINLIAPDQIILHGELFNSKTYLQEIKEQIQINSFSDHGDIPIKLSKTKDELVITGAGALAIQQFLINRG